MKNKWVKAVKAVGLGILVLVVCRFLYTLLDTTFNGIFVDWFTNSFVYRDTFLNAETNDYIESQTINWYALKSFLYPAFLVFVLGVVFLVRWLAARMAKKKNQQDIGKIADILRKFQENQKEIPPLPGDYARIEAQLHQIREKEVRQVRILEKETRKRNDLITYLAHDLKTPLASVIGYLSLLDEVPEMPPAQKAKYIGITLDKAYRLEELINEFFDITRFNLQAIQINLGRANLGFLLQQLGEQFYPILEQQRKKVVIETPEELWIWADGEKLARVFNNILKNAIAYSYEDTVIEIRACRTEDKVKITFSNLGDPIPPNQLETIFEKFFRLDSSRSTHTGGAGLGLAIAKEIVQAHGGEIYAESGEERTVFTVMLPDRKGNLTENDRDTRDKQKL
ncbi:sensor histidine kinase [Lactonifactor longoviformis]|uniref:histidine kinase n=1 Tax=Lactonifactor longoviformis DSM 17459 TaxID=1122155 RepID=A0A1M4YBK8_9CLOT|nr:ATP-binding protein [Lactonifactor longoviformis]SHF03211.1 two-component system, OmpR family, sensor histidine kinase VanS [Lactonifactor longoviformis DSM 17459]